MIAKHPLVYHETRSWGCVVDDVQQYESIKKLADSGDYRFKALECLYLFLGKGCKEDGDASMLLMEEVYNSNDADAICMIGEWLQDGYFGEVKRYVSWRCYQKVCKLDVMKGMYMLGHFYYERYKISRNPRYLGAAKACFDKASDAGHMVSLISYCISGTRNFISRLFCFAARQIMKGMKGKSVSHSRSWWRYRDYADSWPRLVAWVEKE